LRLTALGCFQFGLSLFFFFFVFASIEHPPDAVFYAPFVDYMVGEDYVLARARLDCCFALFRFFVCLNSLIPESMGNAPSGSEKGRRMISQLLSKPYADDAAGKKKVVAMFGAYDTNKDGKLNWSEAKQYISDLLELSGMQAVAIREARESGQTVSVWYTNYIREIFDYMDTDKDGFISIEEVVERQKGVFVFF
jgi:hypothetical protein